MSNRPDRTDATAITTWLHRIYEILLLGFSSLFLLSDLVIQEIETFRHRQPPNDLNPWFFAVAALFFLLFLRSLWKRIFIHTTLYQSIVEASAPPKAETRTE